MINYMNNRYTKFLLKNLLYSFYDFKLISYNVVCSNNFCTNGGTCFVNSFGDLSCLCPGDWTGTKCNGNYK